jgi:hypothetical protein
LRYAILLRASGEGSLVPDTPQSREVGNASPIMVAAGKQLEVLVSKEGPEEVNKIKEITSKLWKQDATK